MSDYKSKTASALDWKDFIYFIEQLKLDDELNFALLFGTCGWCGLRIGDALRLRVGDLKKDKIELREEKTTKNRIISVNKGFRELIDYVYGKRAEQNVVPSSEEYAFTNRWGSPLSLQYVNRRLKELFDWYGLKLKQISTHSFRKGFGRHFYTISGKTESSLITLSQVFGHSTLSITRRYIGLEEEQIADVYLSL